MAAESRKPTQRARYQGTQPTPMLSDYASEAEITATGQARSQVNSFNTRYQNMTMPYGRASELREGMAFRRQQEAAIRAENVGAAPYRGFGNQSAGLRRRLPDVGP